MNDCVHGCTIGWSKSIVLFWDLLLWDGQNLTMSTSYIALYFTISNNVSLNKYYTKKISSITVVIWIKYPNDAIVFQLTYGNLQWELTAKDSATLRFIIYEWLTQEQNMLMKNIHSRWTTGAKMKDEYEMMLSYLKIRTYEKISVEKRALFRQRNPIIKE